MPLESASSPCHSGCGHGNRWETHTDTFTCMCMHTNTPHTHYIHTHHTHHIHYIHTTHTHHIHIHHIHPPQHTHTIHVPHTHMHITLTHTENWTVGQPSSTFTSGVAVNPVQCDTCLPCPQWVVPGLVLSQRSKMILYFWSLFPV